MTFDFEFRKIIFGSEEYRQSLKLREQILRIPLGLKLTPQELERDKRDLHLGGFKGEQLIACLVLSKLSSQRMKMRQVAVLEELQCQGVGAKLVKFSEEIALENKIFEMELSARATALKFYLRQGYLAQGESYSEQNIPHIKMFKALV